MYEAVSDHFTEIEIEFNRNWIVLVLCYASVFICFWTMKDLEMTDEAKLNKRIKNDTIYRVKNTDT